MYLLAYGRLYSNKGAMTPGPDGETVDGMSLGKIERIIDEAYSAILIGGASPQLNRGLTRSTGLS